MFKIENYITPIITNYLAKYVKNIRPQDFQMSLWEGEVTFQNLDLRLDVLQKELKLPFELLSGHIHELSIQVPWTKITSEPIRVNINTIEFILESKERHKVDEKSLKKASSSHSDGVTTNDGAPASISPNKKDDEAHISRITRTIINNINVRCENVIFKYIAQEADIVVLMMLDLFKISSANEKWQSAVEDINAPEVISRKLITILYISLYLDKNKSSCQIDACNDPLLYRCSLECRILRSFTAQTKDKCSTTRIGVYTSAINLNLSSMQIPMLMHFIKMVSELAGSKNTVREMRLPCQNQNQQSPLHILTDNSNENKSENQNSSQSRTSYFSWAWSFLPQFLSSTVEEEQMDCPGHINEFGIYVKQFNFILKNCEYVTDALNGGALVVNCKPIIQLKLRGVYIEIVKVKEIDWKNIKMGISNIRLEPLDSDRENTVHGVTLQLGPVKNKMKHKGAFFDKSLFDDGCPSPEKGWIVTRYEDYMKRFTDTYLMYRGPAFAFDQLQCCLGVEEMAEDIDSATSTNSEKRFLRKQIRVIGTGVVLRYNTAFQQKKCTRTFEFATC